MSFFLSLQSWLFKKYRSFQTSWGGRSSICHTLIEACLVLVVKHDQVTNQDVEREYTVIKPVLKWLSGNTEINVYCLYLDRLGLEILIWNLRRTNFLDQIHTQAYRYKYRKVLQLLIDCLCTACISSVDLINEFFPLSVITLGVIL